MSITDADLFGWQEIAEYLGVHERTAKIYERDQSLPVRRFMGRVEARKDEIRQWRRERTETLSA